MTLDELKKLTGENAFAAIDLVFADFILRRTHSRSPELFAAAALASFAVRAGNSCCDLNLYAGRSFPEYPDPDPQEEQPSVVLPPLDAWLKVLRESGFSKVMAFHPETESPETPLVMDNAHRLYLNRYFRYEKQLAGEIRRRCTEPPEVTPLPPGRLAELSPYFKKTAEKAEIDYQQSAVFLAFHNRFSIITGGPGTGKTTVAAALLALELERNPELEIALCAPTGKAQARLRESVAQGIAGLSCSQGIKDKLALIPCGTIHSLLRPIPGTTQFRHNEKNPLRAGLIVVDEASMVSLSLMAKLMQAVRPDAKVVLLGDKDQLASVDAGAVLADICACGARNVMFPSAAKAFRAQTSWNFPAVSDALPLSGNIAELVRNHRSANAPTICAISAAIRDIASEGELRKGRQAYVVYPLISESERLDFRNLEAGYEQINDYFLPRGYKTSIVHGKLKPADKDREMRRFASGETQLLVATTVIEVGVNVPNASVMVIESAERFGLSQLHQLRGRVGRGADQSYCILMTSYKLSNESRKRIETMTATNDGFEIAEADLKLRGPGDIEGTQQSGLTCNLKVANLGKDTLILSEASRCANEILEQDPDLAQEANQVFATQIKRLFKTKITWRYIS